MKPRVFLDFSVNNEPVGRVIFELFKDTAPRTAENFRALCTGEKGLSVAGNPLYYRGSIVHRSIKDFMIQAGDFTKRNGTGGESIYGGTFADENLIHPLDSEGLLCMANKGPDTNSSQFFITLRECEHLNGKHVVFGKVIRGYNEVIKRLAEVPVDEKNRPTVPILISNCGELELRKGKLPQKESKSLSLEQHDGAAPKSKRSNSVSDEDKHHRKKSKRTQRRERRNQDDSSLPVDDIEHVGETEEEYDARLEREENERLERERKRVLERIAQMHAPDNTKTNGIRFKGRGRMKYVDPEIHQRHS
ncbi:cyclophilin-like domain-containing protein [Crucibulum laeve]|uniref:peptidylprolyl isomerase n=1 Tax=Crucibulum laeve TaxID=68775 RepID=A0A5C3M3T1_9AGAR|nr:cyclophilin-like domain-containing protein [Crucibulum laeve]